jgi:hypothetical protein
VQAPTQESQAGQPEVAHGLHTRSGDGQVGASTAHAGAHLPVP